MGFCDGYVTKQCKIVVDFRNGENFPYYIIGRKSGGLISIGKED